MRFIAKPIRFDSIQSCDRVSRRASRLGGRPSLAARRSPLVVVSGLKVACEPGASGWLVGLIRREIEQPARPSSDEGGVG